MTEVLGSCGVSSHCLLLKVLDGELEVGGNDLSINNGALNVVMEVLSIKDSLEDSLDGLEGGLLVEGEVFGGSSGEEHGNGESSFHI